MNSLPTPKRTRREQAQARHDQILGAALSLFSQQGYAATSTKQIAERVGITEGLLYHYFASKLAILETITQRTYTITATLITALVDTEARSPRDLIPQLGENILQRMREEAPLIGILLSESQYNLEIYQTLQTMLNTITAHIVAYLDRRVLVGELRPALDTRVAVDMLVGSILYFFLTHRHLEEAPWQAEAKRFLQHWFATWYEGIAAPGGHERAQ
jgi:AcrR family transcriptional regulator